MLLEVVIEASLIFLGFFIEGTIVFRSEIYLLTLEFPGCFVFWFDEGSRLALFLFFIEDIIGRKLSGSIGS